MKDLIHVKMNLIWVGTFGVVQSSGLICFQIMGGMNEPSIPSKSLLEVPGLM